MPENFGSPNSPDFVASVERQLNSALDWGAEKLKQTLESVASRPLGSEKVSPQDELAEYHATIAAGPDPEAMLYTWFTQRAQQVGREQARIDMVDYVKRNEARMQDMVKPTT